MKKIGLIGAGGMASEIIPLINRCLFYEIDYLYANTITENIQKYGYNISNTLKKNVYHIIAVGYPEAKVKIIKSAGFIKWGDPFIDSSAFLGKNIKIGLGSIIYPFVTLTSNIEIGKLASINSNVTIGHDCMIGAMFHASAGSVVSGNVTIGDNVFLGANSTIKENLIICNNVIVGAGSVVVKDILKPGVYIGCPAKSM